MKAEDMVMVIENRKGHETNSLLTFDDFIKQHIVPFANDKLEAVFMARELMDIRSKKIDSWADWYHSANQSFYARICANSQEISYFLCGTFNDDKNFRFDEDISSKECLEELRNRGMTTDGKHTVGQYSYQELGRDLAVGEILHNFNGCDYKLLERFSEHNLLLMDISSGQFLVGIDTRLYLRQPKFAPEKQEGETGIEWGHGLYLSNMPSVIDFARLKREYSKPYQIEGREFDIEIREILSRVENIKADTLGDAIDKAMAMYERSEVVLNADDYKGVDYIPVKHTQR